MKFSKWAKICWVAAALVAAFMAGAQTKQPLLQWPISTEAVHAAPNNHRVLFENDSVRLLEVTVQPGQTEPLHWHMYPSVFAINGVLAALTDHTADSTTNRPRQFEDADWTEPQCRTMPVQAPHQVTGAGPFPRSLLSAGSKQMVGKSIKTNWAQYKH